MMDLTFSVIISEEDFGVCAEIPDYNDLVAFGETVVEAISNVKDLLIERLNDMLKNGEHINEPVLTKNLSLNKGEDIRFVTIEV